VPLTAYLVLAALVFAIGLFGVLSRRNAVGILLGIELMLNAVNINLAAFARFHADVVGLVFALFTIAITVAEVGLGLAIVIVIFRVRRTVDADRLDLLRATRAHYEQLFLLYEDSGEIDSLLASQERPVIEVVDEYGVAHRVWQVSDSSVIRSVQQKMRTQKLVIADGHHRYETALNFRNECRAASGKSNGNAPHEFVMMTFVNLNDPGMLILPTHRVVHSLNSFSVDEFHRASAEYFEVEEVEAPMDAGKAIARLQERGRSGTALLAVTANRALLLHSPKAAAARFFAGFSARQQSLDVVQLHKVLLEGVLKLSEDSIRNQQNLSYLREASEALAAVRGEGKQTANITFLMNPCPVQKMREVALAGEVMPQKSTDFYPKLLSGLTAYALD